MSVFGGVALFTAGVVIGGSVVAYHSNSIRKIEDKANAEREGLQHRIYEARYEVECDRAYRKGYCDGQRSPLSDAEKLVDTFKGRRVDIRHTKGA